MPSQDDPHAGHQLFDAERLGDVVVTADGQAVHLVFGGVLRGEEDDRHFMAAGIQAFEHLHAVDVGEHDVEDHKRG
jgi:hypothetical protein